MITKFKGCPAKVKIFTIMILKHVIFHDHDCITPKIGYLWSWLGLWLSHYYKYLFKVIFLKLFRLYSTIFTLFLPFFIPKQNPMIFLHISSNLFEFFLKFPFDSTIKLGKKIGVGWRKHLELEGWETLVEDLHENSDLML